MNSKKPMRRLALTSVAALLFVMPLIQSAHAATSSDPQQLSLSMSGTIVNSGKYDYTQSGGQVFFASILGQALDPTTTIQYKVHVEADGLTVKGESELKLSGETVDGMSVSVHANFKITGMVPAETFPLGCTTDCNSAIAAFYLGNASLDIKIGNSHTHVTLPMSLESAFINPFGGPLILTSMDGANPSVFIVATYGAADIHWFGVQLAGAVAGTLNGEQVTGAFNMISSAKDEDLFAGTESETGEITFTGMTIPMLDVAGSYTGSSVIPSTGTVDCSSLTGVPGTCTLTGFQSSGQFSASQSNVAVQGTYDNQWGSPPPVPPALTFEGTATSTVTQN